jgi:hypothetical protein
MHEEMASLMQQSAVDNEKLVQDKKRLERMLKEAAKREPTEGDSDDANQLRGTIQLLRSEISDLKRANQENNFNVDSASEINALKTQLETTQRENNQQINQLQHEWNKERSSLRDEVRRLNLENSRFKRYLEALTSKDKTTEEDEDDEWTKRYNVSSCQSRERAESMAGTDNIIHSNSLDSNGDALNQHPPPKLSTGYDSADISCLQSIISTLRDTIHQTSSENETLRQKLNEEQQRSQQELQSFANTLSGVDDLRKSAERMSRELRRIKIKGHKPTRSDLLRSSDRMSSYDLEFGEADEASKEMEDAIRLIECQNDALNQRWSASPRGEQDEIKVFTATSQYLPKRSSLSSRGSDGLTKVDEENAHDDGFMSYWHHREDDEEKKKEKKAKEKRKKKKASSGGSVFTSFF